MSNLCGRLCPVISSPSRFMLNNPDCTCTALAHPLRVPFFKGIPMGEEPHFQGHYRNVIKASLNSRVVELLSSPTPRNRAKTTCCLHLSLRSKQQFCDWHLNI